MNKAIMAIMILVLVLFSTNAYAVHWTDVKNENDLWSALNTHKPVVVMFSSPWCRPCQDVKRRWSRLSGFSNWKFLYVDFESAYPIASDAAYNAGGWQTQIAKMFHPAGQRSQGGLLPFCAIVHGFTSKNRLSSAVRAQFVGNQCLSRMKRFMQRY